MSTETAPWTQLGTSARLRRMGAHLGLGLACLTSSTLVLSASDQRRIRAEDLSPESDITNLGALGFLLAFGLAIGIIWRWRYPLVLGLASCAGALVLGMDTLAALICLAVLMATRADRPLARDFLLWGYAALTLLATFAATWWDTRGLSTETSMWRLLISEQGTTVQEPFSWWTPVLLTLVLVGATVGAGWALRSRRELATTRVRQEQDRRAVVDLNQEVARQREREVIAREVHDAIGHRLSLLNLHAGALETAAGSDDPRVHESAQLVREGAQTSMAELRHLLEVLREPGDPDVADSLPGLGEVSDLVEENLQAGVTLVAHVNTDSLDGLAAQVSASGYRIVQEVLTNARKHAPGVPLRLVVKAEPGSGISVESANHLPSGTATTVAQQLARSGGHGLTSITERAHQHGGQSHVWVDDDGVFRVAAHLPWEWASVPAEQGPEREEKR